MKHFLHDSLGVFYLKKNFNLQFYISIFLVAKTQRSGLNPDSIVSSSIKMLLSYLAKNQAYFYLMFMYLIFNVYVNICISQIKTSLTQSQSIFMLKHIAVLLGCISTNKDLPLAVAIKIWANTSKNENKTEKNINKKQCLLC